MNKSKAIKEALDIVEECNKHGNGCEGCYYQVKDGKFKGYCMVNMVDDGLYSAPNGWLINRMLGGRDL